ncbi:MAG: phosphodiester glycosidase family protein [Fimbriimonadaceae bacterium]
MKILLTAAAMALVVAANALSTVADGAAAHYTFQYGSAGFHAILADTSSPSITATAQFHPRLTNVWNMIAETQPIAAITGTFFAYENQHPVADIVINGEQKATGYRGSILAIDWYGKVSIQNAITRKPFDYLGYRYAMRGGVRVVDKGEVKPNPRSQGFTDPAIWGSAARTGVGITKSGKIILVATTNRVSLSTFGKALKSQGAVDAVSLDGGGSTMLYFNGDLKISTSRGLCNLFLIEKKSAFDDEFRSYLNRISESQTKGALQNVLSTANSSR